MCALVTGVQTCALPICAAGAGLAAAAGAVEPPFCAAATTSSLVIRPSLPVPVIVAGSTPHSSTARRTDGDSAAASPWPVGAGGPTGAAASDDRKSVGLGKGVSVRVDPGGRSHMT